MTSWTPERDARLTQMWANENSKREMCRALNVSIGAIDARAGKLGLPPLQPRAVVPPKGPHCRTCFIGVDFMAGCPREECRHYAEPLDDREQTLGGIGSAMLVV